MDELLACFLDLAGMHHALLELRTDRAFSVHSDRDRMFDLLEKMGYLWRQGGLCYWTAKIEVVMADDYRFFEKKGSAGKEPFR